MRTLCYSRAEKSILKFLLEIYELGREIKLSKNGREYTVNSYYLSKSTMGIAMGLHPQTITRAINNLSDKKIIKIISIVSNKAVKGSVIYFNSDLYLHPETIKELSDILDYVNTYDSSDGYIYEKITKLEIDNFLLSKNQELNTNSSRNDIKEEVEPIEDELKKDRNDITLLYKMFLKQNKTILKSLDLIAEQNKIFAEQNKAVVKSLDLLSEVVGKIGSVGTINQVVDKTILNNPKVDNEPQFTVVSNEPNEEDEKKFETENIENNLPDENAESAINNGLITISNEKHIINGQEVITIEAEHSIIDTGPDIDVYLYENDEEYAKEVADIKDRDNITEQDLDYFRYLKNISNNFYHRFFDKIGKGNYFYGLSYVVGLIAYRYSVSNQSDVLLDYFRNIDRDGWVTYYLVQEDYSIKNIINDLPIQPANISVGEAGLILNYSDDIPNISEPYKYKINFDFIYRRFKDIRAIEKEAGEISFDYELLETAVSLGISEDIPSAFQFEKKYSRYDFDYAKKHILLKLFYISLKRSQTERLGDFTLGRNSYYEDSEGKLVMHKAIWLIINKVDYQPFVKQLLIDYTEWCCGGGDKWIEEIEKYIIPKKRISSRRIYNGLEDGSPAYDIEYIESELLDGHLIRRIYDKMINGKNRAGFKLGLDEAGLGKASKRDIPNYRTDTKEYQDLFYRFIGLVKTGFGYCSMNGIKPIAKDDFEFYKRIVEERMAVIISRTIGMSMTSEEYKETDFKKKARIWNKYRKCLSDEFSLDSTMLEDNFLDNEDSLTAEQKEFLESYPTLILKLVKYTQFNCNSKSTLLKAINEKLEFLRKELKRYQKDEVDIKDSKLGLKSKLDIKKIADNLNENQKNYI